MCEVLFLTPNITKTFRNESLGTLQLATILKNHGVSCKVIPFGRIGNVFQFDSFVEAAIEKIDRLQPKIVSMYTRCDTFHISLKLAQMIRARWSDMIIVFGGPQSDTTSADVIANVPYVDYVCCGEGETTVYPFFSSLLRGEPDLSVAGLVYRKDGQVVTNPRPELIADLDSLPMIDFMGTYLSEYPEDLQKYFFPIDVGRGCPFGCSYCSTQAFWGRKYRLKTPGRIIEEIKAAHYAFGANLFIFSHDMFTFNRKLVMETCRLIRELDFPIRWACSARMDCLDRELIDVMVDAGVYNIFVGIETGSKRMQKLTHKNLNLDKVMDLLIYLKEKNVVVDTSFIYGFPEETKEDLSQTLAMLADIMYHQCGKINTHLCTFLPKTELSQRFWNELIPTDNYTNFTGDYAIEDCKDVIKQYPMLFPQLMEYRTELRTELKHFALFIRVWMNLTPVYHHISKRYDRENLIAMYYDFVRVNQEVLEKYEHLTLKQATLNVIREDKFHLCAENDAVYDLILDCRRMYLTENSEAVKNGEAVTEVYCFDPTERKRSSDLETYQRCLAAVNYFAGKYQIAVCPLQ